MDLRGKTVSLISSVHVQRSHLWFTASYRWLMQCSCVVNDMQIHVSTMCYTGVRARHYNTVQLGTHNVVSKVKRGDFNKLASLQNTYTALLTSACSGQSVVYMQFCFT